MRWLTLIFVVLFLYSNNSVAQTPQISFEGQPVGTVDLVANPKIDVEDLQPLVEQKSGQPYSNEKIQASVAALNRTGMFSKVEVDVKPEAAGLHVRFVLEPAFYYGVIDFPGSKAFPYGRLLQLVNLPDQEPYEARRVQQAETALLHFLQTNGFFKAQVHTSTQLDEAHHLANVAFQVQLGKRAKIGRVEVQGPPTQEAQRLLQAARSLRAGGDRKSTRLNSSHLVISYAVFCLKKKKREQQEL